MNVDRLIVSINSLTRPLSEMFNPLWNEHPDFIDNQMHPATYPKINIVSAIFYEDILANTPITELYFGVPYWNGYEVIFTDTSYLSICEDAFETLGALHTIHVPSEKYLVENISFIRLETDSSPFRVENICINGNKVVDLVLPDGITEIFPYALMGYQGLESITFPKENTLTTIWYHAFLGCTNLREVRFYHEIENIETATFDESVEIIYLQPDNNNVAVLNLTQNQNGNYYNINSLTFTKDIDSQTLSINADAIIKSPEINPISALLRAKV